MFQRKTWPAPWFFSLLILPPVEWPCSRFLRFGTHGLLWTDASANILVFAIVAIVYLVCGLGLRGVPQPESVIVPTTE